MYDDLDVIYFEDRKEHYFNGKQITANEYHSILIERSGNVVDRKPCVYSGPVGAVGVAGIGGYPGAVGVTGAVGLCGGATGFTGAVGVYGGTWGHVVNKNGNAWSITTQSYTIKPQTTTTATIIWTID